VEDVGGTGHVYFDRVVFPVRVTASNAAQPVTLRLKLEYGVCKDICIPANASLALKLDRRSGPHGASIEEFLARVPRPQPLSAEGPLSITGVRRLAGDKPTYEVRVRAPDGAVLFAEPPENWYVSTSSPQPEGRFTVTVEEKPKEAAVLPSLRLTLVAGSQAIETEVQLDPSLAAR
jgi:DsbC/DsbD-like thiol-disulfide interchange protein